MRCPSCNNEVFYEHVMYKVIENVKLKKINGTIEIESHDISSVEPLENFNEFKCSKCGNVYTIAKDKGEEVLVLLE